MSHTETSSQPDIPMTSDVSAAVVDDSNAESQHLQSECLEVVCGEQSGVSLDIANKSAFSVGTEFSNDVVLRSHHADTIKLIIESHQGIRHIMLQQGQARIGDTDLLLEQWYELEPGLTVSFAEVSFLIRGQVSGEQAELEYAAITPNSSAKRSIAVAALVAGIALLGVLGVQERRASDTDESTPAPTLEQRVADLDLENLEIIYDDADKQAAIVHGRVDGRDDFRRLQQMLNAHMPTVSTDVQIDSDIAEGLHDIYRNHGFEALVDVPGKGHARVETAGVDEQTMITIEEAIQADLPMLVKLDIVNTPPEKSEPDISQSMDPEKEVEAVVEGAVSYVLTRDQSRYFIGGILPSGHTIKSIEEGTVLMSRAGELTKLKF